MRANTGARRRQVSTPVRSRMNTIGYTPSLCDDAVIQQAVHDNLSFIASPVSSPLVTPVTKLWLNRATSCPQWLQVMMELRQLNDSRHLLSRFQNFSPMTLKDASAPFSVVRSYVNGNIVSFSPPQRMPRVLRTQLDFARSAHLSSLPEGTPS